LLTSVLFYSNNILMKKIILFFIFCGSFSSASFAQYYYKDILSNVELLNTMALYKENKVRTVVIKSFEDDGSASDGFFCEKKISRDYKRTQLFTRSNISASSTFISIFNNDGKLASTLDSSDISSTKNIYSYDEKSRIHSILSLVRSHDDDFTNAIQEEHIYEYNDRNQPVKMIKVKNGSDSTVILFANDERNNVSIEKDTKSGAKYYYYYDAKNRLTDIVQANDFRTSLHPDYIFEYNSANQVSQMTATEEGGNDYFVWKYTYDNGMRIREKCFTKERKLMGSVEYEYK
jgi:hypothetical protein